MKNLQLLAYAGAIALLSTGFTACSSDNDVVETNPNYNPEKNEVNTQFVLNVATKTNATRSSAANVQESGTFRGMDKVKLFAFNTSTKKAVQKDAAFTAYYDLDRLFASGAVTAETSNRIVNINIPVGTDAFLFYGKAMKGDNTDDTEGKINYDISITSASKIQTKFDLEPRASSADLSVLASTEHLVADILNIVFDVSYTYTPEGASEATTITMKSLGETYASEKDLAANQKTLTPLELSLAEAFYRISTLGTNELRAGSADAILSVMSDLKSTLKVVRDATPTGEKETAAHDLAVLVNTKCQAFFIWNSTTYDMTFNDITTLKAHADLSATWGSNTTITNAILGGFPQCFGLPAGCSLLTYNTSTKKFEYKTEAGSTLLEQALYNRDKMMYPAELTYYCNGPIRTADTDKMTGGYPNGTANWTTDAQWTAKGGWTSGPAAVTSSTRAAALIPNVNYGVALLQSAVKLADETTFNDNRYANTGEADRAIAKADVNIAFTGIIIGGQCPEVGWDFLRRQTTDDFDRMIYDNRINGEAKGSGVTVPTSGTSANNYTLVFDNYVCGTNIDDAGTQAGQNDVFVALEFVNNGDDFWGQGNLVRKGTTFYLTAQLPKPTETQVLSFQWPGTTDADVNRFYEVPPIDENGASRKIPRVFVQDYRTTATFTIGKNSLKNALVTVPDLRSTQMSFGLSVDLTWKPGITYDIAL